MIDTRTDQVPQNRGLFAVAGTVIIIVPGEPRPWRVFTRNTKPPATWHAMQEYRKRIQAAARNAWVGPPLTGPVHLETEFYRSLPGKAPKGQEAYERYGLRHIVKKSDLDNYRKVTSDALEEICYLADSQIVSGNMLKWYVAQGEAPYTLIRVRQA